LPLSNHETILHHLSLTADLAMDALQQMDIKTLERLSLEQAALMRELNALGQITDRALESRLHALLGRIREVQMAIEARQHEIVTSLKRIADGRKMLHAYGR
jgi:hypothetical protein